MDKQFDIAAKVQEPMVMELDDTMLEQIGGGASGGAEPPSFPSRLWSL